MRSRDRDRNHLRKLHRTLHNRSPSRPDHLYDQKLIQQLVNQAVARLSLRDQQIISLHYYTDATTKQIGELFNSKTVDATYQRIYRAHRRLRDILQHEPWVKDYFDV